jgi:hypothetical protein
MRSKFGDETFIAALLKDLGVLVLIKELGQPYSQLLLRAYKDRYELATLEYRAIGFDHTQLAGRFLRNWSLPDTLINTIDTSPQRSMPLSPEVVQQRAILDVAEKISLLLASGRSDDLREILRLAEETLRLDEAPFYEALGRIEELVLQLGDILSLQLPEGLGYEDLLNEARERMKAVSSTLDVKVTKKDISPEEYAVLEVELQNVAQMLTQTMARRGEVPSRSTKSQTENPPETASHRSSIVFEETSSLKETTHDVSGARFHEEALPTAPPPSDNEFLLERIGKAIVVCREKRLPLSLLVCDVVLWKGNGSSDAAAASQVRLLGNARHDLEQAAEALDYPFHLTCPYGEHGVAVVLLDCERSDAIEVADDLIRSMPKEYDSLSSYHGDLPEPGVRLGVGIASASSISPNFLAEGLIEGAERCLHVALTTIGRSVKSIEVF